MDGSERCFQGFVWWRSPLRAENFPKPYGFLGYYYHQRQMQRIGDGKAVELQCPTVRPGLWSPGWRRRNLLRIPYRFLWELNGIHQKKKSIAYNFLMAYCHNVSIYYRFLCVLLCYHLWECMVCLFFLLVWGRPIWLMFSVWLDEPCSNMCFCGMTMNECEIFSSIN